MRKIAALYGGTSQHYRTLHEPKYHRYFDTLIYLPDLKHTSLHTFDVLLLPSQLHMGLVVETKEQIREFAEQGGALY